MKMSSVKKLITYIPLISLAATACSVQNLSQSSGAKRQASETLKTNAELPRVYIDTSYTPSTRSVRVATTGDVNANLQAAIDNAQPGDEILLPQGVTFRGNFRLKPKTGWVTIRTDMSLPAAGTRITSSYFAQMAKIVAPSEEAALIADGGAKFWRIIGVELTYDINYVGYRNFAIVRANENSNDIILDRVYIHGQPSNTNNSGTGRCVWMNNARTSVIDSHLSLCVGKGFDAQAIGGLNGPGPFKIVNNYLEGSGQFIIFGGGDPSIQGLVPSDIEIRRNYMSKPTDWNTTMWSLRYGVEFKNAQRVLLEENIIERSYEMAVMICTIHQSGTAPWTFVGDVTVRWNHIISADRGISLGEDCSYGTPGVYTARVDIHDNLIEQAGWVGIIILGKPKYIKIQNNTILSRDFNGTASMRSDNSIMGEGWTFINNIIGESQYGWHVSGGGPMPTNGTLGGNLMVSSNMPTTTSTDQYGLMYARNISDASFQAGNYNLSSSSVFKGKGLNGIDPGVNHIELLSRLNGVR